MSKRKHSVEWMLAGVQEYLDGKGSYDTLAAANGIGATTLVEWIHKYNEQGPTVFYKQSGNAHYAKEFKIPSSILQRIFTGWNAFDSSIRSKRYPL